jgi:hypothetical protein
MSEFDFAYGDDYSDDDSDGYGDEYEYGDDYSSHHLGQNSHHLFPLDNHY